MGGDTENAFIPWQMHRSDICGCLCVVFDERKK